MSWGTAEHPDPRVALVAAVQQLVPAGSALLDTPLRNFEKTLDDTFIPAVSGPISFDRDLKKFLRDCARYPQIFNMRLEEAEAFSAAMMSTIKSKSSWKPRPNPKKPNKKLGQPKITLVFDSDDNAEKCDKLFDERFCIETKDGRLFFYRIPKNEQQKKQSRVWWVRGILASPDAHDEEEVKEAKEVVAKEGDEDGLRPAVTAGQREMDRETLQEGTERDSRMAFWKEVGPKTSGFVGDGNSKELGWGVEGRGGEAATWRGGHRRGLSRRAERK
uniref:Uncharacterized protein n=1 Tax=Chromera velia CCMP2878 TaxID=1169474 RepID=A0A0G4I866_9ALVE|eukprot:Cvel_11868.t1-p1 / transcript=Cvel_11868.t1 / gene=Cvel_11868 / organism=Chromera_velia_CCMP2878 / gene_product=hypothetical protein / transcript_product=hypothetical protein / location=Cvel_scaffold757:32474-38330(-) / protein_length=273 / sequence_SO=supercontig / SO=protein_coding / is_pseudo=false